MWYDIWPTQVTTAMSKQEGMDQQSTNNTEIKEKGYADITGVIHANMNSGADDSPSNQRHPKFGAIANASATSKHAPRAQKH